jgi:hypothetical protein
VIAVGLRRSANGRCSRVGAGHPRAKFPDGTIELARDLHERGISQKRIALLTGMARRTVRDVIAYRTRAGLPDLLRARPTGWTPKLIPTPEVDLAEEGRMHGRVGPPVPQFHCFDKETLKMSINHLSGKSMETMEPWNCGTGRESGHNCR